MMSGTFALILLPSARTPFHAYIDAGTGSMIIQAVIGGSLAGLVALRIFWGRITTFFKNRFSRGTKREGTDHHQQ